MNMTVYAHTRACVWNFAYTPLKRALARTYSVTIFRYAKTDDTKNRITVVNLNSNPPT